MSRLISLWRDRNGAGAAEFALVLPLLLLLIFGIIDGGRYLWEVNQAKKATMMGARFAVVTDPVEAGIVSESFLDKSVTCGGVTYTLTQGDIICDPNAMATITCTATACDSSGKVANPSFDSAAFASIVSRMQLFNPAIQASDVRVSYSGSGLGFAGDPNGADIAPLVTVSLSGMRFNSIVPVLVPDFPIPEAATSLTAEDFEGTQSN